MRQKITLTSSRSTVKDVQTDSNNNGVLLYALHLRFMCPFPKKCSRSVPTRKSDPLSTEARNIIMENEDERSFYLYDDMKVVFPQRHSDSDEGKVYI